MFLEEPDRRVQVGAEVTEHVEITTRLHANKRGNADGGRPLNVLEGTGEPIRLRNAVFAYRWWFLAGYGARFSATCRIKG